MLIIVPTPIGNLKDITLRSLEALGSSDGIICEDTRRASLLLNHYQIKKPLIVLNDFNEERSFPEIISKLQLGQNLCLISDAGTPLVSDPGYKLVRECLANKIEVDSLPGPTAPVTALTLSGLPPERWTFLGYLPEKEGKRIEQFKKLSGIGQILPTTFIVFVAPHKLQRTLEDMQKVYGDIEIVLTAELTKIHQRVNKGPISQVLEQNKNPKGEFVLLFRLGSSS